MRLPSFVTLACLLVACSDDADEAGPSAAASGGSTGAGAAGGTGGAAVVDCAPGDKSGVASGADGLLTAGGLRYNVRAPADYQPTRAHPLLVVFSPRVNNATAEALEAFTGLAPDATARGYLIAFAEWFDPLVAANRADADTIRVDVAAQWCIDAARVYYTGHSDGAGVAMVLAVGGSPIAAVAPSASGMDDNTTPFWGCGESLPVMVIHSSEDRLFPTPSFGLAPADFWAECAGCGQPAAPLPDGCVPYADCAGGAEVLYCETTGGHYEWYGLNASMLDFFDRHALR